MWFEESAQHFAWLGEGEAEEVIPHVRPEFRVVYCKRDMRFGAASEKEDFRVDFGRRSKGRGRDMMEELDVPVVLDPDG